MLVGVSIILFTIMRLAPGGPEAVLIGGEFSQEAAAQIRQRLGLDRPIALQYLGWAGAALRGDLGRSFKTGDPVAALIRDRLGPTIQLTFGALALALGGGQVVWRHALRNALIPVVTVVGLSLPTLVGGAVLTETVFAWPGIGRLAVGAVFERDYPVIMGVNLMVAAVVITANLITDLAYCVIDPRISYR